MKLTEKLYYRISISVVHDGVKYDSFVIDSDEDLQVLFHCRCQFSKVRIPELLAKLVDVVSSSGRSNRNHQSVPTVAASSSTPIEITDVGANINTPVMISHFVEVGKPDVVEDVLGDDNDVEPAIIEDDSDDDIGKSILVETGEASSSETHQYSSHFSTIDLDVMRRKGFPM
ncbi:hypothetical protein Ahy_A09g041624 isoform A [Arachis hypogaea]|uniref:Uncharacterized protein n=1 Tax=Arachis hypogaea TaxID=3818 RepID=A0A445BDB0_ARAHY|nr:hypothetical protein Ahy_A09g041624 isoform A [Arachis hypogaea]